MTYIDTTKALFVIFASASFSIIVTKSEAFKWLRVFLEVKRKNKYGITRCRRAVKKYKLFLNYVINCPLCFGMYSLPIIYSISIIPFVGDIIILSFCSAIISAIIWSRLK